METIQLRWADDNDIQEKDGNAYAWAQGDRDSGGLLRAR